MRLRRLVGSLITAAVAATPLAATSAPASAATPTTVGSYSSNGWLSSYKSQPGATTYGDTIHFSVNITTTSGGYVDGGTTAVQRLLAGTSTWSTVASASGSYVSGDTKAVRGATYRVVYTGTSEFASTTAAKTVPVQRKVTYNGRAGRRVKLTGKVAPTYHGKVIVQKKTGKHWKRWKTLRAKGKGRFATYLPAAKRRTYFRLIVPGSRGFATSRTGVFYTYKY